MAGMKTRLLFVACAATVSLAACGGGEEPASSSGTPSKEAQNRKAMLDFARCMRENGVDMPDPQFEGGRVTMKMGGKPGEMDPQKMQAAEKACAKYREAIKPPEMSDEESAEFKQQALAHSRCMRENGIDMPDPTFDENGGAQMRLGKGLNPESAKFQKAQEACRETQPMGPGKTTAGEGGE
jgi:hypothetical protein